MVHENACHYATVSLLLGGSNLCHSYSHHEHDWLSPHFADLPLDHCKAVNMLFFSLHMQGMFKVASGIGYAAGAPLGGLLYQVYLLSN